MTPAATATDAVKDTASYAPEQAVRITRRHTQPGQDVYEMTKWDLRTASITDDSGKAVFEQKNCEIPSSWSDLAMNIVASKYFRGTPGTPQRESSVRFMIHRVAHTIADWGRKDNYFSSAEEAQAFEDELTYLLLFQHAAFNSPVWFNVGVEAKPQCSACFINSVDDSMESILGLARTEGMIFKYGSGSGTNLSALRSSKEYVKGGGLASGPVSFMKGYDAFAGVIKSGGKTRRAAKMVILNIDHPDVVDFVECKMREEKKAHRLIEAGYDGSVNGEAYSSVFFQNANHSVRVSDAFMESYLHDGKWSTKAVVDGSVIETMGARDLMRKISHAAHTCGDPGIQFDDSNNRWHTCKKTDRIYASNPCSEYVFLDNTACNLASINLMKYMHGRNFDMEGFRHACRIMITAQEIVVDNSSYPTPAITENSKIFRTLGLGFANLGAMLMHLGVPYDSREARGLTGAITSIMTGSAYAQSALVAEQKSPFEGYAVNRECMLDVIRMHRAAVSSIERTPDAPAWRRELLNRLSAEAQTAWDEALAYGERHGYRNAQVTVLAPTGTIAFMMDCDTTGVEPDIALIKYKRLSGGGTLKIVNQTVRPALENLGYEQKEVDIIVAYIDEHETIEGAPYLKEEHLPVFDCAFKPKSGKRTIEPMGHVRMMAAAQPFISGAISKTVNLPENTTVEEIEEIYVAAWKLGLKALAIYRDGCKRSQPLSTTSKGDTSARGETAAAVPAKAVTPKPFRRRLPTERHALTHRFDIQGHEGYITVGLYEDGKPGEIFLKMSKEGSTISGLMDTIATLASMALQYGVPLSALVKKFSHMRFDPAGFTTNPDIPMTTSIVDYTFRWLGLKFLSDDQRAAVGMPAAKTASPKPEEKTEVGSALSTLLKQDAAGATYDGNTFQNQIDAPLCSYCGTIMVRQGSCHLCRTCGSSHGCS